MGHQRRGVDQEGDGDLVGPGVGLVVEHIVEPAPALEEVGEHLRACLEFHVRGHHVEQVGVADLVLGLGQHRHLGADARRLGDPVPLGEPTHELGVGVHLDEREDRCPVVAGHVVVHFDDASTVQEVLERFHRGPLATHHMLL